MLNDFEKELQEKGWLRVVRHLAPGNQAKPYLDMAREMSVISIPNGPVGNGRLHEYVFYFQKPNDILDFGERMSLNDCDEIHKFYQEKIESGDV